MTSAHQNSSSVGGEDFLDYGEKLIKPGELLHLPTVKTASKNSDNLMYIVARVGNDEKYLPIKELYFTTACYYLALSTFIHSN
jgi:hypothetical protein